MSFFVVPIIWSTHATEHPNLMKEVNVLMDRLFGWDPKENKTIKVQKNNKTAEQLQPFRKG